MKPTLGQKVIYEFGFDSYTGRVIGVYDDCFVIKGIYVGMKVISLEDVDKTVFKLLFKDGQPVMSKWYLFMRKIGLK